MILVLTRRTPTPWKAIHPRVSGGPGLSPQGQLPLGRASGLPSKAAIHDLALFYTYTT